MKPIFYIAFSGDMAADETSCMVAVEHFTDPLAYGRRLKQIMRAHKAHDLDSWTCGQVELPKPRASAIDAMHAQYLNDKAQA